MEKGEFHLFIEIVDKYERTCDGCNRIMSNKEPYISGIESCCGDCYRYLCKECIKKAFALLCKNQRDKVLRIKGK